MSLDMERLFKTFTDEKAAEEAAKPTYQTVPTGSYIMKGEKLDGPAPETEKTPQRLRSRDYARFGGPITTKAGEKKGWQFFDGSWVPMRVNPETGNSVPEGEGDPKWKYDKPFKLFSQLEKAFDMQKKPVGEVLEAFKMYPINVFVTERFQVGEREWKSPETAEQRAAWLREGLPSVNSVASIGKVK